jgi:2-oxoglutarate dehydrogenase E1 component
VSAELAPADAEKHARVLRMIHAYRARGHRIAHTDPLGARNTDFPELDPAHYGFGDDDLDRRYIAGDLPGGAVQTLRQILDRLSATYCRAIGVEFMHVQDPGRRTWLQRQMEESQNQPQLDTDERLAVLEKLSAAELFELVIGMAHRGRLNVLSNILGKSLESIFSEFEDNPLVNSPFGSGDVKYHKGYSKDREVSTGERVHLSLTANPSHLEAVNPVVEGRARAKQLRAGDLEGRSIMPLLVHGDAAFSGQGIVAETLNLSNLTGYSTGGTLHVVVDNQIGFTTNPAEARSTLYATDVAKMTQTPIFNVNADDPEAVVHCVKLAMAYRQRFGQDAVIDLVCYRRQGHNEGDEPSFTQPLLYRKIDETVPVRKQYTQQLIARGLLRDEDVERIEHDLTAQLRRALRIVQTRPCGPDEPLDLRGLWTGFSRTAPAEEPETGVPVERLAQLAERISTLPPGFRAHPKLSSLLERRQKVIAENKAVDWGMAEPSSAISSTVRRSSSISSSPRPTPSGSE